MYVGQNSIFRVKRGKAYFNARASRNEGRVSSCHLSPSRDSLVCSNTFRTWYVRYFLFAVFRKRAESVSFCVRKVDFPAHLKFYRIGARKWIFRTQNDTDKTNLRFTAYKIVYFVSCAERHISTQKRVATRAEFPHVVQARDATRSCVKIHSARDTYHIFCSLYTES